MDIWVLREEDGWRADLRHALDSVPGHPAAVSLGVEFLFARITTIPIGPPATVRPEMTSHPDDRPSVFSRADA
jgi:hypothetical protein